MFQKVDERKLFYLTAESDEVLAEPELGAYYVIGGLVDHNSRKGHCHSLAEEKSIPTVRLPISEHIDLKTRHVLTINHVFEILLAVENKGDWKEALMEVIPQRKGHQVKEEKSEEGKLKVQDEVETQPNDQPLEQDSLYNFIDIQVEKDVDAISIKDEIS